VDTTALRDLTDADGPFASVHFDFSHDTEDAAKLLALRLKEIEAGLTDQRADPATVEAVLRAVRDSAPPVGKAGRSIIAAHGDVLLDRRLAAPPPEPVVRFSALPYLLPLIIVVGAVAGIAWAGHLRERDPEVYSAISQGRPDAYAVPDDVNITF